MHVWIICVWLRRCCSWKLVGKERSANIVSHVWYPGDFNGMHLKHFMVYNCLNSCKLYLIIFFFWHCISVVCYLLDCSRSTKKIYLAFLLLFMFILLCVTLFWFYCMENIFLLAHQIVRQIRCKHRQSNTNRTVCPLGSFKVCKEWFDIGF